MDGFHGRTFSVAHEVGVIAVLEQAPRVFERSRTIVRVEKISGKDEQAAFRRAGVHDPAAAAPAAHFFLRTISIVTSPVGRQRQDRRTFVRW